MRRAIPIGVALGLTAAMLSGCGGGGGTPGNTTNTTTLPPMAEHPLRVVTYNLYWWCTSGRPNSGGKSCPQYAGGKGFQLLWNNMKQYGPWDLIGMQECEDAQMMGNGIGYGTSHEWKQGPADIGMGYSKSKFEKIGDFNSTVVGQDQWGLRYMAWVRLKYKGSDATVFYANTHGALPGPFGSCDGKHGHELAHNYIKTVADNIHPGDALVVTGDFNCLPINQEIWDLNATWTLAANDRTTHFDHIYIRKERTKVDSWNDHNGHPSDHSILWANISALTPISRAAEDISAKTPISHANTEITV